MEPSWLPQYHQTNLGINNNNNNNNNNNRIIKEHDYIIGLSHNSSSTSSKFTHNTMNHGLSNLNNTHQKNDDDDDDDNDGAAAPAHDDGEEEDDHTDLCLGLGLPGSRNPAKNGNNSNNNIITKPITTTTTTTTTINLNHAHNNGVKRGYNEAILLLDRYSTMLPSTGTNRPNEKLACEPPPPLNNDNDPDNTNANANANVISGVIGVGIGVGVGVSMGHGANDPPPAKDRVIGWPPIRSYRKNTLVKSSEIFVKVNMDGVAVGRKVDLNAHTSYEGLLFALEDMFLPSNSGGSSLGDSKHLRLLNGLDYVLTYEDKDGDWMLVGDVPWSMFTSTVKRLRIQRGVESMGIGKPLHK